MQFKLMNQITSYPRDGEAVADSRFILYELQDDDKKFYIGSFNTKAAALTFASVYKDLKEEDHEFTIGD